MDPHRALPSSTPRHSAGHLLATAQDPQTPSPRLMWRMSHGEDSPYSRRSNDRRAHLWLPTGPGQPRAPATMSIRGLTRLPLWVVCALFR
ncbi:hypothetical protein EV646_106152 [Kribbella antiqua]|uniref:Uncharacterized protein n=1 Tax=Kribbella antiqua TaxID=2512217 RepID=A0A4R2IP10_9ACTN|nr:hypothetical protein EV646_106152 [Kribbella antiqua]